MEKAKKTKGFVKKIAMYIAKSDANTACPYISYQPPMPDSIKKLRKF